MVKNSAPQRVDGQGEFRQWPSFREENNIRNSQSQVMRLVAYNNPENSLAPVGTCGSHAAV